VSDPKQLFSTRPAMDPPVDVQALLLVLVHTGIGASFAGPQRTER
jgi:hypothetical protein